MAVTVKENMEIVPCSSSDNEPCFDFDCKKYKLQTTDVEHPKLGNDDDVAVDMCVKPASLCAYCDKNDPVVAYCDTCASSLCTFCYDCHIRQNQYKSHNVTNFENVVTSMAEQEIMECPKNGEMPSNIECVQIQEPSHLITWELNKMEKGLSKIHNEIEEAGKILAIQTEKESSKLDQFYTELMHDVQLRKEQNLKQLHDKALELENISLAQLKEVESVQSQLECLKRCLNKPDTAQVVKELLEKYEVIVAQPVLTSSLQFVSPDVQTLPLGEVVCTNSETNNVQEGDDAVFHECNPQPPKSRICARPRSNSVFKLPTIKVMLKRNNSDSSIKRLKRMTANNSKDGPLYHINHIKFPKRIKTNGGTMGRMFGVGFSKTGTWAAADYNNHCVHVCNANNELVKLFGNKGQGNGQFEHPVGVTFDNKNCLYVSEYGNHRVQKFDANFEYVLQFGDEGSCDGQLNHPMGIAAYKDKVYVADSANSRIAVFYTNGKFCCNIIGGCLRDPYDLAINKTSGQLLVTDSASCVRIFTLDGTYINRFSSFGADQGQLNHPLSLAVDSRGFIFVADTYNHRICIFNYAGTFIRSFGSCGNNEEQFNRPQGVAFSPNGNLYISDYGNQRVMIFPTKFKLGQKHHY